MSRYQQRTPNEAVARKLKQRAPRAKERASRRTSFGWPTLRARIESPPSHDGSPGCKSCVRQTGRRDSTDGGQAKERQVVSRARASLRALERSTRARGWRRQAHRDVLLLLHLELDRVDESLRGRGGSAEELARATGSSASEAAHLGHGAESARWRVLEYEQKAVQKREERGAQESEHRLRELCRVGCEAATSTRRTPSCELERSSCSRSAQRAKLESRRAMSDTLGE